jgi:hypothetical protein
MQWEVVARKGGLRAERILNALTPAEIQEHLVLVLAKSPVQGSNTPPSHRTGLLPAVPRHGALLRSANFPNRVQRSLCKAS